MDDKQFTELKNILKEIKGEITRGFNKTIETLEDGLYDNEEDEKDDDKKRYNKKNLPDTDGFDYTNWEKE